MFYGMVTVAGNPIVRRGSGDRIVCGTIGSTCSSLVLRGEIETETGWKLSGETFTCKVALQIQQNLHLHQRLRATPARQTAAKFSVAPVTQPCGAGRHCRGVHLSALWLVDKLLQ